MPTSSAIIPSPPDSCSPTNPPASTSATSPWIDAVPGLRKVRASLLERLSEDGTPPYFDLQIGGGRDGTLTLPGWPTFRIEVLRAELRPDGATLKRSAFRFAQPVESKLPNAPIAFIEAKGTIPSASGATAELNLTLTDIALADILPKNSTRYLSGTLQAEALRLTWRTSDPANTWAIEGPVTLQRVRIRELAVLDGLGEITSGELAGLDFDDCSAVVNITSEGTRISEIRARGIGRAHMAGEIKIASNGKLDGLIQLGVSEDSLPEVAPPFFKPGDDSALWTSVVLSGTIGNPAEDLSARITAWAKSPGASGNRPPMPPEGEAFPAIDVPPPEPGPRADPNASDEKVLESLYKDLLKEE